MFTMTEPTIIQLQTSVAAQAVAVGRKHHTRFEVMPRIGVLTEPVVINGWRCVPRDQDDSPIPREADLRVGWLREEGIAIMQEIVMHEPGELLPVRDFTREKEALVKAAKVLGVVAVAATAAAATVAIATLTTAATVVALGVDPALCVCLEDGTWTCVASWRTRSISSSTG
jgi:hypothetical protein